MGRLIWFCMLAVMAPSALYAQAVSAPKWQAGETLSYRIADEYSAVVGGFGETMKLYQALTLTTTWEVKRVSPEGDAELTVSIDTMQFKAGQDVATSRVMFDSTTAAAPNADAGQGKKRRRGPGDAMGAVFRPFLGNTASFKIDRRGQISQFTLSEKLSAKLKEQGTQELAGFFGDLFTAQGVQHRLTNWMVVFPADPPSKGGTWKEKRDSRVGPKIPCVRTYTVVGPEKVQFAQAYDASGNENFSVEKESSSGVVSVDANRHHVKAFELEHSATILGIAKQRMEVKYAATRTVGADDAN